MLVYHLEKRGDTSAASTSLPSKLNPMFFRRWAVDNMDPVSHGVVLPLYIEPSLRQSLNWEKAWVSGQSEYSWGAEKRRTELAQKATCVVEASRW
jgi:hypothetical protein